MLVLSRRKGQKTVIGDGIEVEVLSVLGNTVRLGVVAPREIPVHRDEILKRIEEAANTKS
jgi:carbon storage regulator